MSRKFIVRDFDPETDAVDVPDHDEDVEGDYR